MRLTDWPSLDDEKAVAADLFGPRGTGLMRSWLTDEFARTDDLDFAREFSDHVALPGISTGDYLHRVVHTSWGKLLGGIRFYGRDITRPFVEVVAHSFESLDRLRECVDAEWSMFGVRWLRLCTRPDRLTGPHTVVDVSVFAARYQDMTPVSAAVTTQPFADPEAAIDLVARRYAQLASDRPALARNVSGATAEDLRRWHGTGELRAITVRRTCVGLLAVAPGRIRWLDGDEINEEVVDFAHRGHGYAAAAQAAWAAKVACDPSRLLIGTIDRLNTASRRTAVRAGRLRVLDYVFVGL